MDRPSTAPLRALLTVVVWLVVVPIAMPTLAIAQAAEDADLCVDEFAAAEEAYFDGRFAEANELLSACLNRDDLPDALLVEMARLSALAYINLGNLDQARRVVIRLLNVDPSYEPDEVQDPPSYVSLVSTVQRQLQMGTLDAATAEEDRGRGRTWLAILGGAVLAGAATSAVLLLGGNGDGGGNGPPTGPEPLPEPPRLP
ncbi:MAG: hypothetical protein GVY15_04480 [Bacteroidetes bacterium]|jgi:tetratricopeptide (TPR) repeat protein|nr:hypothetical protein [Bacteroidota bacterium]